MILNFRKIEKEASCGREITGIVVRQGLNSKTVTVRGWWKTWQKLLKKYKYRGNNYQVHDDVEFCRVGDVVQI